MKTAILSAAVLAVFAANLHAQDKVKLEVRAKKGDKYTHSAAESNDGKIHISIAGQEIDQEVKEREVRKYTDEILEVEGNEPTRIRRKHVEWSQSKAAPGEAEPTKTDKALAGKTIVLKKAGDKTEYEGAEGIPAAELKKNRLRPEALLLNLPAEPVAIGATWTIDEKKLKEDFGDDGEGGMELVGIKATGKLEKIEDHKGVRCAVLLIDIDGDGTIMGQKEMKLKLKLKAWIWLALESGRPLTMKGDGTGDLLGELEQDGNKIKMKGKFVFKTEGDIKYE
jgi:hypothetical protein